MTDYSISDAAAADLKDAFVYGYLTFGLRQADAYIDELHDCFLLLAENPRMGRTAADIGAGVRRHEHGSHIILYREALDGVAILAFVPSRSMRRLRL